MKTTRNLIQLGLLAALLLAANTPAQTLTTVVNFTNSTQMGGYPISLTLGYDGDFYGMTASGGQNGYGAIFKVTPAGAFTNLVDFAQTNGGNPFIPNQLALGPDGNLYGVTGEGGYTNGSTYASGYGTVFKLTTNGVLTPLILFTNANGNFPSGPLVLGNDGNFYGCTALGGQYGQGSIFRMKPDGTLTNLYSCSYLPGFQPNGLTLASDGNFYGTCSAGGTNGYGSIFRFTTNGTFTSLYAFSVTNGSQPEFPLIQGSDGNLYGTTALGGITNNSSGYFGYGTVFKISTNGILSTVVFFDNTNGNSPQALTAGPDGNIYGTTSEGGNLSVSAGTIFRLTPAGQFTTLFAFSVTNGLNPVWLTFGTDTNLYGNASEGGSSGYGTIFRLSSFLSSTFSLGTYSLVEGSSAGSDSVILVDTTNSAWISTPNASWLHLSLSSQSGFGSTNVTFSFDANPGPTRTGTLTIAGQTVTITQAGSTYVQAPGPVTTLFPSGNQGLAGVAVDQSGNVYFCDAVGKQIEVWNPTNNIVSMLTDSGLNGPVSMALDTSGNIYIADYISDAIKKWTATNNSISTVVSNLNQPYGVAVDGLDNIYIADTYNNATEEWLAASNTLTTLVSSTYPEGVAVDVAGNVYIGNRFSTVQEWSAATKTASTLVSGLNFANDVAVDGSGDVYIADYFNNAIREWFSASNALVTLVSSGLSSPSKVAVDGAGNLFFVDGYGLKELPHAFVDPTPKIEPLTGGSDSLPVVLPATENLLTPFNPTSDSPWLTITSVANGVVSFSFTAGTNRVAHITLLGQSIPVIQPTYALGTTNLVEGPDAGLDGVVVAVTSVSPWTATPNASWLHLSSANQSGTGSTNLIFSFDANPGATRAGALTIAGQTLTVTQAGVSYVQAPGPLTTLASSANGLNYPYRTAVDGSGNVYISDNNDNAIKKWTATNNTLTTLVSSGLNGPIGVAVDGMGNIYIADEFNNAIKEWIAASNAVVTVVSGLNHPYGVAVDGAGNLYIADSFNDAIKEWSATSNTVTTLVSSGLDGPSGVAVDAAGNVYIADYNNNLVKEWTPANNSVTTLFSSTPNGPHDVAVDGSGNLYVADDGNTVIKKWTAVNSTLSILMSSGFSTPTGVTVDASGNVYVADPHNNAVEELPHAFVDPTPKIEPLTGGSDSLPVVLPATENLLTPFNPTSDSPWLTITSVANGVVSFSFTAGTNRVAHITLLGQSIPVIQPTYALGTTNLVEGPDAGLDSVVVAVTSVSPWTATPNASWLHLSLANQSGAGSTNVIFSFDANPGATRAGALTIAGQTLTVTQAGATYVQAPGPLTTLASSGNGLNYPIGVALDTADNVYVAQIGNNAIAKWTRSNNSVSTPVSASLGLHAPYGVAVDATGNIFIADNNNQAIKEWVAASNTVITLVSNGLYYPAAVVLDGAGNVYFADSHNNAIKEWIAASGTVTNLVASGLYFPSGVAVDVAGNVYIADTYHNAIKEWNPQNNAVTTLPIPGLNQPGGLAVDGSGNVYIADTLNNAIEKWSVVYGSVTPLASSGLSEPGDVVVDAAGNVYFSNTGSNIVEELPRAFVDPTPKVETFGAGSDTLPPVVPATANLLPPFYPTTDQPWLTVNGSSGGVVNFSFTQANTNHTGHIMLLGQNVTVSQVINVYNAALTNGQFLFTFTNYIPEASYNVLSATNLDTPLPDWIEVDAAFNLPTGSFQFAIPLVTTNSQRFYRLQLIQ